MRRSRDIVLADMIRGEKPENAFESQDQIDLAAIESWYFVEVRSHFLMGARAAG